MSKTAKGCTAKACTPPDPPQDNSTLDEICLAPKTTEAFAPTILGPTADERAQLSTPMSNLPYGQTALSKEAMSQTGHNNHYEARFRTNRRTRLPNMVRRALFRTTPMPYDGHDKAVWRGPSLGGKGGMGNGRKGASDIARAYWPFPSVVTQAGHVQERAVYVLGSAALGMLRGQTAHNPLLHMTDLQFHLG